MILKCDKEHTWAAFCSSTRGDIRTDQQYRSLSHLTGSIFTNLKMASIIPVNNETTNSASRITAGGRKITYVVTVIQQPERARACGSGAKSSADRRPVDPPPIIELRIFEGEGPNQTDITSSFDANYFMYGE